ncbi:MAG TPA: hypothetical protein VKV26_08915 [Dehalococcoidia bacterium]|nr:hypothetical protein [Dehalococcoidia bacterium]
MNRRPTLAAQTRAILAAVHAEEYPPPPPKRRRPLAHQHLDLVAPRRTASAKQAQPVRKRA